MVQQLYIFFTSVLLFLGKISTLKGKSILHVVVGYAIAWTGNTMLMGLKNCAGE